MPGRVATTIIQDNFSALMLERISTWMSGG
jgi:hypothetical protein